MNDLFKKQNNPFLFEKEGLDMGLRGSLVLSPCPKLAVCVMFFFAAS
jgi:hypothetical protein